MLIKYFVCIMKGAVTFKNLVESNRLSILLSNLNLMETGLFSISYPKCRGPCCRSGWQSCCIYVPTVGQNYTTCRDSIQVGHFLIHVEGETTV